MPKYYLLLSKKLTRMSFPPRQYHNYLFLQEDFVQGLAFYDQAIQIYIIKLGYYHPVTEAALNNKQLAETKCTF